MSYRLSRAEELSAISWPGLIEDRNLFVELRRLGMGASCAEELSAISLPGLIEDRNMFVELRRLGMCASCVLTSTFLAVVLVDSVDLNFGEPDWETQFLTGVPWVRKLLAPAILI